MPGVLLERNEPKPVAVFSIVVMDNGEVRVKASRSDERVCVAAAAAVLADMSSRAPMGRDKFLETVVNLAKHGTPKVEEDRSLEEPADAPV